MAGKSVLIKEILRYRRQLFTTEFSAIFYCMPEAPFNASTQKYVEELKHICPDIQIIENLPGLELLQSSELPKLFVLDDLMESIFSTPYMSEFFTRTSHHFSNSIIFTSQNYFNNKRDLTITRNLSYKLIFYKTGELTYMSSICRQFSRDPSFLEKIFALLEHEESPNGIDNKFILFDSHPKATMRQFPVRAMILPRKNGEIRPLLFKNHWVSCLLVFWNLIRKKFLSCHLPYKINCIIHRDKFVLINPCFLNSNVACQFSFKISKRIRDSHDEFYGPVTWTSYLMAIYNSHVPLNSQLPSLTLTIRKIVNFYMSHFKNFAKGIFKCNAYCI